MTPEIETKLFWRTEIRADGEIWLVGLNIKNMITLACAKSKSKAWQSLNECRSPANVIIEF